MFTGLKKQFDFGDSLIEDILPLAHDLVKLKNVLNWQKINGIYRSCYSSNLGNSTKRTELILGLFILKHLYKLPYRRVIEELHVNTAFMYFCSVSALEIGQYNRAGKKIIDHSTLVKAIGRLGSRRLKRIERLFTRDLIAKEIIRGKYLFSDTTSLEKNICYPTEVSLLKRVIEHAEMVVQRVVKKKELVKTELIKKANQISKLYYSSTRKTQQLLCTTSKQLLSLAKAAMGEARSTFRRSGKKMKEKLSANFERVERVGAKIVEQVGRKLSGLQVTDKIVSFYEDHVRALPKGKVHKPCEFGTKLRVDMNGDGYITNYHLYQGNPADVGMLVPAVSEHADTFEQEFKAASMDRSYYDSQLMQTLENKYGATVAIPHKKDRSEKLSKRKQKLYDKRSAIESKISEGKRMIGLDKSYYRGFEGDLIWSTISMMTLNIRQLLRDAAKKPVIMKRLALENAQ
jgi:IS5 family transposase